LFSCGLDAFGFHAAFTGTLHAPRDGSFRGAALSAANGIRLCACYDEEAPIDHQTRIVLQGGCCMYGVAVPAPDAILFLRSLPRLLPRRAHDYSSLCGLLPALVRFH
jgi:hypothetical protein